MVSYLPFCRSRPLMTNHKRKRPKHRRAGCLMCKSNKFGHGMEKKLGHRGYGKLRKLASTEADMRDVVKN